MLKNYAPFRLNMISPSISESAVLDATNDEPYDVKNMIARNRTYD